MIEVGSKMMKQWKRLAGNRRLFLLCLLLFLASTLLSFWIFFPAELLQQRLVAEISRQSGLKMQGDNSSMLFPLGLELDLLVYPEQPELAPINLQSLQVTPAWTSLVTGVPAAELKSRLAGGSIEVLADNSGRLELEISDVELETLQQAEAAYRLQGRLSGKLKGEQLSDKKAGKGQFTLQLRDPRLFGLDRLGLSKTLQLGQLDIEGKFNQRRLSIGRVLLTDGDIELSGGGTVLVGDTPAKTRLNLNVRLFLKPTTPKGLRDLLSLTGIKPTADGSYLMRLGGTLARPVLR